MLQLPRRLLRAPTALPRLLLKQLCITCTMRGAAFADIDICITLAWFWDELPGACGYLKEWKLRKIGFCGAFLFHRTEINFSRLSLWCS
jgi:hypothetical protein